MGVTRELARVMYIEWERMDLEDPVPLIPGAKDVLRWAKRNGIVNCLLTTRNRENVTDIFRRIDLESQFGVISCKQDAVYRKPDPRAFYHVEQELKERFGISFRNCIFIGDTADDMRAGKAANIRPLLVQTGPNIADGAERMDHPDVLPSVDELPGWLASQTNQRLQAFA